MVFVCLWHGFYADDGLGDDSCLHQFGDDSGCWYGIYDRMADCKGKPQNVER